MTKITGTCDICKTEPAVKWFGGTSVAICNKQECYQKNVDIWNANEEEAEAQRKYDEEYGYD